MVFLDRDKLPKAEFKVTSYYSNGIHRKSDRVTTPRRLTTPRWQLGELTRSSSCIRGIQRGIQRRLSRLEPIAVGAAMIQSVVIWLPGEIYCRTPIACRSVASEGFF